MVPTLVENYKFFCVLVLITIKGTGFTANAFVIESKSDPWYLKRTASDRKEERYVTY